MKALIFKKYGKSNAIQFADVPRPSLKPDEILVRVHAVGLNPIDAMIPKGTFKQILVHLRQQFLAASVEHLALAGEREPARRALQQAHTQPRLQLVHMARDRGLGHGQRVCRADKAARVHHGGEGAHFLEFVHGWLSVVPFSGTVNDIAGSLSNRCESIKSIHALQHRGAPPGREAPTSRTLFMKTLVIGAGNMGSAFVKQLHSAGHSVSVTARQADKAATLAAQYPGVRAVAPAGAAADADVVILATGYTDAVAALQGVGGLAGKVVVDITNPLTADYMGLTLATVPRPPKRLPRLCPTRWSSRPSTPCSPRCWPLVPISATARPPACSSPATARPPRPL